MNPIEGLDVELVVPLSAGRPMAGTTRYRTASIVPEDLTTVRGLIVTTPARTVIDLASVMRRSRLHRLIESSTSAKLLRYSDLDDALLRGAVAGRPGALVIARVLDDMSRKRQMSRSKLEEQLARIVEMTGLPEPIWEYPLPNAIGWTGFVDCCWPEVQLIVEADSRTWHDQFAQADKDDARDAEAARVGYQTQRLRWRKIVYEAEETAKLLVDIYSTRAAQLQGRT